MRDLAIIFRERLEHGIEGIDLNFEFKMASSTKCRTYSGRVRNGCRVLDFVDTQTFSPTLLLPIPASFVYMVVIVMCWFIALTFDSKTSL